MLEEILALASWNFEEPDEVLESSIIIINSIIVIINAYYTVLYCIINVGRVAQSV